MRDLGDLASRTYLYERALRVREAHPGPDDPDTVRNLTGLANVLRDQGDLNRGRTLYERALAIDEARLGPDHPDTARNLTISPSSTPPG